MKSVHDMSKEGPVGPVAADGEAENRSLILEELDRILASRHFKSADRSSQFLRYVVMSRLEGHTERLKERTIGTDVFQRSPGYATGEDPVVRVQAGEVRRRLQQYYQESGHHSGITIELPVGSYAPFFHTAPSESAEHEEPAHTTDIANGQRPWPLRSKVIAMIALAIVTVAIIGVVIHRPHTQTPAKTALEQFWSPIFATREPVLVCVAKPVAYRPSEDIYRRYSRSHPGTFQTESERSNTPLPLDPDEKLTWGDFFIYKDFGVAAGDVYAAVALSGLFGRLEKPSQLRIGSAYSYQDLRNSPAAVIGGFNNKWTIQLLSNLRYAFDEDHENYMIREQVPGGRVWTTRRNDDGDVLEDFAIVSRLIDSKTGQFTVTVAGIGPEGTRAAGEFVTSTRALEDGLASAPADWPNRNLEVVLQTTVTDSVAGPPHVVAIYSW